MIEIIKETFFSLSGVPILVTIFFGVLIYDNYFGKNKDNNNNKKDVKLAIKVYIIFMLILFGISTIKYTNKEFDPSDVKTTRTPDSSVFYCVGYDKRFQKAVLVFNDDMENEYDFKEYIYNMDINTWNEFINSDSLGEYYNKHIKGKLKSYIEYPDPRGWGDYDYN